jgi:predicted RNA binding protein YcfA (HicA-like mRNA interferase family)
MTALDPGRGREELSTLLDTFWQRAILVRVTAREVVDRLLALGCRELRQSGSHRRFESSSGHCKTTVPDHGSKDLGKGLLRAIERDMEHGLGKGWLR